MAAVRAEQRLRLDAEEGAAASARLVADSWGDSGCGCVHHVEEVLMTVRSAFIADESPTGLGAYLHRR